MDTGVLPLVEIVINPGPNEPDASQVAAPLRTGTPSVHVDSTNADTGTLMLVPACLGIGDVPVISDAFASALMANT